VPVNFGLKYRPPKLGLQYQITNKETTVKDAILPTFVHEISLHWVTADSDVDSVFNDIVNAN
jgi:predicted Zn-dependent protease with MMP-like domain